MENFKEIKKSRIFYEIEENDVQAMAYCFGIRFRNYNKNAQIAVKGEPLEDVFLLLKGGANVENMDSFGDTTIVMKIAPGDAFGLEGAFAGEQVYSDNLVATENSLVMIMNKHRLITPCFNHCKRHEIVVRRLMKEIASRNMQLLAKLKHLSRKSIRGKVLSYLHSQRESAGMPYFDIPFNKTELANYLSVDRSALSTELNKMKAEGILDFDKKHYHLKVNIEEIN